MDQMLHSLLKVKEECIRGQIPTAGRVYGDMLLRKVFKTSAGLSFDQLLDLAIKKGLVKYNTETGEISFTLLPAGFEPPLERW